MAVQSEKEKLEERCGEGTASASDWGRMEKVGTKPRAVGGGPRPRTLLRPSPPPPYLTQPRIPDMSDEAKTKPKTEETSTDTAKRLTQESKVFRGDIVLLDRRGNTDKAQCQDCGVYVPGGTLHECWPCEEEYEMMRAQSTVHDVKRLRYDWPGYE